MHWYAKFWTAGDSLRGTLWSQGARMRDGWVCSVQSANLQIGQIGRLHGTSILSSKWVTYAVTARLAANFLPVSANLELVQVYCYTQYTLVTRPRSNWLCSRFQSRHQACMYIAQTAQTKHPSDSFFWWFTWGTACVPSRRIYQVH